MHDADKSQGPVSTNILHLPRMVKRGSGEGEAQESDAGGTALESHDDCTFVVNDDGPAIEQICQLLAEVN